MCEKERNYARQPDFGDLGTARAEPPVEWDYVPARRRPGAPDGSLPVRVLLIDEGAQSVDERGPGAVSVAECARRVGVSKGAPYTWFADAADFRLAVAASLTAVLVEDLATGTSRGVADRDPVAMLAQDVGAVVRNWTGNGMGLELIFVEGGPASRVEVAWEAERFRRHFSSRVHDAAACSCSAYFGDCHAQRGLVDGVLALCHGFAALARATGDDAERVAASAEEAATRLLSATG